MYDTSNIIALSIFLLTLGPNPDLFTTPIMATKSLLPHYTRLLRLWPLDRLRASSPSLQFQRLLEQRLNTPPHSAPSIHASGPSKREINAAYLLLDDTFGRKYKLSERMMKPQSQPEHYERLAREIEEAPDRSWFGRVVKRLGGMVRFR